MFHQEIVAVGQSLYAPLYDFSTFSATFVQRLKCIAMHNNTSEHSQILPYPLFAQRELAVIEHVHYSPDLMPIEFLLFCHLNMLTKVKCIPITILTAFRRSILQDIFSGSFQEI